MIAPSAITTLESAIAFNSLFVFDNPQLGLLATFNILAFLFHTLLDLTSEKYQFIRQHLPTRKTFFDDLRALTRYLYFDSWENLLDFMIHGLELEFHPNTS